MWHQLTCQEQFLWHPYASVFVLTELYHLAIFLLPFWVKMARYDEGVYFVTSCITA